MQFYKYNGYFIWELDSVSGSIKSIMANNRWYTKGLQWGRNHYVFTFTNKFKCNSIDFENLHHLRDYIFDCECFNRFKGEGGEWLAHDKALICWNTQLSSSKNIFRNCWVFWLLYDLK